MITIYCIIIFYYLSYCIIFPQIPRIAFQLKVEITSETSNGAPCEEILTEEGRICSFSGLAFRKASMACKIVAVGSVGLRKNYLAQIKWELYVYICFNPFKFHHHSSEISEDSQLLVPICDYIMLDVD